MADLYQLFVRLLDGKHKTLNFTTPSVSAKSVKHHLCDITAIPIQHQRLISNGRQLEDQALISIDGSHMFPTVHLLLRLRGGKGGLSSLLRAAATKAGQKKTSNFDACRDMSGRRLRHVNAEKKLEEWRAEMGERRLEKMAEEFIKKKAKAIKKAGGSGNADKYVEKYRQDSAKCMEEVERSVRESIASHLNSKRKAAADGGNGSEAKRFKIWMGKRKWGDSDSDDIDEDSNDDAENERSVVTNHGTSNNEGAESSDSVNGKLDAESSGAGTPESGSEESLESPERLHGMSVPDLRNIVNEPAPEIHEGKIDIPLVEGAAVF